MSQLRQETASAEHVCKIEFREKKEAGSCCAAPYIGSDPPPGGGQSIVEMAKCREI